MAERPEILVAQWIDRQREERNADAPAWCLQRTAWSLLACYPSGQGQDVLWGLVRRIAGPERESSGTGNLTAQEGA